MEGPSLDRDSLEKISCIVDRVTFHNPESGWSVLKVTPIGQKARGHRGEGDKITVTVHQTKVYAGATVDFYGEWTTHPKFGEQFKAGQMVEKRPASSGALEKYLGSGLIFGVGPKTAKRIVQHFGGETLEIFEHRIEKLKEVHGIAEEKLRSISKAWTEHREIRNVMLFLQTYGISTLFAVKIFKVYGERSIEVVKNNPYQLAKDIYGIGFFSADKVALNLGFKEDGNERLGAAAKHVLSASKEEGHCFLTYEQIVEQVESLLALPIREKMGPILLKMEEDDELKVRHVPPYILGRGKGELVKCYYAKTIFFEEWNVSKRIMKLVESKVEVDQGRVRAWLEKYCSATGVLLSDEQRSCVQEIVGCSFAILTGGPGCGKTTTTKVLVKLLKSMGRRVILAAPTGRAAQRMTEVIGMEAKTLHRLLVWNPGVGGFKKNEEEPLEGDFLIVDECSMLDISLSSSLMKAVPEGCQVLFIGDADQLPSVGAGNVLKDLIESKRVACFKLTQIFRQAKQSLIIEYAHQINKGQIPRIDSPIREAAIWESGADCLFIDSEEVGGEQAKFILKAKHFLEKVVSGQSSGVVQKSDRKGNEHLEKVVSDQEGDIFCENMSEEDLLSASPDLVIPKGFAHVQLEKLLHSQREVDSLKAVLKKIHPWSSLHYGWTASDVVRKLYVETIPRHLGQEVEIQVLSPMLRGSLGTQKLNQSIQEAINPFGEGKGQLKLGEKIFRSGDRVIQKRNNYELGVFNGDIGTIKEVDALEWTMLVEFGPRNDKREVMIEREQMAELDLAYAITIHKSQGSEFDVVIIPVMTQHFKMLFRNLLYTGLTRAKKLAVFVGTRRAFSMGVRNHDTKVRQTTLRYLLGLQGSKTSATKGK